MSRDTQGRRFFHLLLLTILIAGSALPASALALSGDGPGAGLVSQAQGESGTPNPTGEQTLRLAGPADGPETLDPAFARDLSTFFIIRQIFRGLTRFDENLQPVPELAERIEVSSDGLEYTFYLRPDAKFHDGRTVTADDVTFSLRRALDPATAGGDVSLLGGPTFLSDIEGAEDLMAGRTDELRGVTAVDASTVRIRLSSPRSTFLMKLASAPASIVDRAEAERGGDWWRTPNGTGPFRVAEWTPNERLVLARFNDFFGGHPYLNQIVFRLGPSALQPFNLYEADEIDLTGISTGSIDRVLSPESGLSDEVTVTPLFNIDYLAFRTDEPPMDDPHIRRAVQLAFPRHKMAEATYNGYVKPANGVIPDGMLGVDWPADMLEYDLESARAEIAQSVYGAADKVPPIRIYSSGYAGAIAFRDVLQRDLGLQVEVIDVQWADYVNGLARREYPAYELYWGADYPDPESILLVLFGSGRPDNYIDYSNPAFDDVLAEAAEEQDPERRIELYRQAQQILLDDLVVIPLYFDVSYMLAKPWVKGLQITPMGVLGLESVWLER